MGKPMSVAQTNNITNTSMPCEESLKAIFSEDALIADQYAVFDSFVNEHCSKNMDFRVPSKFYYSQC